MASTIRIRTGRTEIEFEGSEDYIREELPKLVELLSDFAPADGEEEDEVVEVLPDTSEPGKKKLEMTTNTIASKLDVKTGADLVIAACAHLAFVKGQESYSRKNILGEMQLANNYYKKSHSKNLSHSLKSLVKADRLLETSQDKYALDAKEKMRLEHELT